MSGGPVNRASGPSWSSSTLLGRVDLDVAKELVNLGNDRTVPVGVAILRQGDAGDHLILIVEGMAKVVSVTRGGAETLLAVRISGDIVGELSALNGHPRTATVTTCKPSRVRVIPKTEFQALMDARPPVARAMLAMAAQRLRWANRRREDFAAYSVKDRLARVIAELDAEHGVDTPRGRLIEVELT